MSAPLVEPAADGAGEATAAGPVDGRRAGRLGLLAPRPTALLHVPAELALQLLDAALGLVEGLLLHHDGLRHVIGRIGCAGNLLADQGFRFRVTIGALTLHCGQPVE